MISTYNEYTKPKLRAERSYLPVSLFPRRNGYGILEYILIVAIIILIIILLVKLFGPAVRQFIEQSINNI